MLPASVEQEAATMHHPRARAERHSAEGYLTRSRADLILRSKIPLPKVVLARLQHLVAEPTAASLLLCIHGCVLAGDLSRAEKGGSPSGPRPFRRPAAAVAAASVAATK